jgi:hypothetical protein
VSRLHGRVKQMGGRQRQPPAPLPPVIQPGTQAQGTASPPGPVTSPTQGAYPPPGTAAKASTQVAGGVSGSAASPPSVMTMPLQQVVVTPARSGYVTVGSEDLTPIWTTDGAGVPASAPGHWGQLRAAGRP